MTVAPRNPYNHQTALVAGQATQVELDFSDSPNGVCVVVKNDGAAAIETTVVDKAPLGDLYGTDLVAGAAIGALASGASALLEQDHPAYTKLRFTFTSAAGSTVTIQARGA